LGEYDPDIPVHRKDTAMETGMLTTPLLHKSLEEVCDFAESVSIKALELPAEPGGAHVDTARMDKKRALAIRRTVEAHSLYISALACYTPYLTDPAAGETARDQVLAAIDAAALLDVKVVCALTGYPAPGTTALDTIRQVLPHVFEPVLARAREKNVRIAVENWPRTCLRGVDTFEALFHAIPDEHLGLNYDPSHLVRQDCDWLAPVSQFRDRIFHVHAKDVLIDRARRDRVGILGERWWRYVLPGFGEIRWGEFISHLRQNGYDGVLSIEHEDEYQLVEEGFARAAWHLEQFC